jgi:hypothetical protein
MTTFTVGAAAVIYRTKWCTWCIIVNRFHVLCASFKSTPVALAPLLLTTLSSGALSQLLSL